jgi:hypothetical protein
LQVRFSSVCWLQLFFFYHGKNKNENSGHFTK